MVLVAWVLRVTLALLDWGFVCERTPIEDASASAGANGCLCGGGFPNGIFFGIMICFK